MGKICQNEEFGHFDQNRTENHFKWSLLCSSSSFLESIGQKRFNFPDIWPNMAEKGAKYANIKGFDTLIKIEYLVLTRNDFKWLLSCSASCLIQCLMAKRGDFRLKMTFLLSFFLFHFFFLFVFLFFSFFLFFLFLLFFFLSFLLSSFLSFFLFFKSSSTLIQRGSTTKYLFFEIWMP